MNLKKQIFALLSVILLCGCSYMKNVQLLSGGSLERQNFVQTIPFELKKDIIVIKVKVNDSNIEQEFIFDTGAFNSKIEKGIADRLGLKTVTTKDNSTAAGVTRNIEVTRIDSLIFGETVFYNIGAGKVIYDDQSASPCIASAGIIGANLMKLAHWKIDYQKGLLYFSDQPFTHQEDTYILEFETPALSGTPLINIKIGGKEVKNLLFDVGYNGGLVLPIALADQFKGEEILFFDRSATGIYGAKTDTLIEKQLEVEIDGFKTNIPVNFSANGKALLGNAFLKHFEITIDYESDQINLIPKQAISISPNATFIPGVLNDSTWQVISTSKQSPFELGESLKSINGKKPIDLFEDHCAYFMQIRNFLKEDSLKIEKANGEIVYYKYDLQ